MNHLRELIDLHTWAKDVTDEAADKIDALEAKIDQYRVDLFEALKERDEYRTAADKMAAAHKVERDTLMADIDVLLCHLATISNITNDQAVICLARVVLERMGRGDK